MAKAKIVENLLVELKISLHKLEKTCGISNGTIKKAIEREADLSIDVIEKIVRGFPQVNKNYLISGDGEMFLKSSKGVSGGIVEKMFKLFNLIPEEKRTKESYDLLSEMIKEAGEINQAKENELNDLTNKGE